MHLKSFALKRGFPIFSKLQTSRKITTAILKRSHRVLQVTLKSKALKQHIYFLLKQAIEFWATTFGIQIVIILDLFWEKLRNCTFQKAHSYQYCHPIQNNNSLKNETFLACFLMALFSKQKLITFGIFNESNIRANVYHIGKIVVQKPTIFQILGC